MRRKSPDSNQITLFDDELTTEGKLVLTLSVYFMVGQRAELKNWLYICRELRYGGKRHEMGVSV